MATTTLNDFFPGCRLVRHAAHVDARGGLVALESGRDVPFAIARAYYLFGQDAANERGFHAHRALDQWAVCVVGACTVRIDNGRAAHDVLLDSPDLGLHLGPMIWHEMRGFRPGTVLLVLASTPYDEADYIRNRSEFDALVEAATRAGR